MMPENGNAIDKINMIRSLLDKLVDAHGRAKCGYIYIIDDFLEKIASDVLIMEEQIKDLTKAQEIKMEGEIEDGNR